MRELQRQNRRLIMFAVYTRIYIDAEYPYRHLEFQLGIVPQIFENYICV